MNKEVILKATNITKYFPGVKALDGVSLEIKKGEILALLGENGAGKSTLIKIFAGVQSQDSGEIELNGKKINFKTPIEAKKAGIAIVYQELANVSTLTVAENLFINEYGKLNKFLNWQQMYLKAKEILDKNNLDIDPYKLLSECNVAEQQQIEIARALYEDAKLLILDEPTSALTKKEIIQLLERLKELRNRGISILFITHKMDEIFSVSDSIAVLRDGVSIAQKQISETTEEELIKLMIGRELNHMYPKLNNASKDLCFKIDNINNKYFKDLSLQLFKGEILGVYGLMGSGHHELGKTLFGSVPKTTGDIFLENKKIKLNNPKTAIQQGIGFVPSERKREGLVQTQSISKNIVTANYEGLDQKKIINLKSEKEIANKWIKNLQIKTNSPNTIVRTLSGGNQQKVILAKWLEIKPKILILCEPTRGIDVGSKVEIYELLNKMAKEGISIIMITSEMPELLSMSHRAIVLHEKRIQAILEKSELTENKVMTAAIGGN